MLWQRDAARHDGDGGIGGQALASDLQTGKKAITDFALRYQSKTGPQIALGVSNLLDISPEASPPYLISIGLNAYPDYSPWGFNGRHLHVRPGVNW